MQYDTGSHCVFYHCYHIVWSTSASTRCCRGPSDFAYVTFAVRFAVRRALISSKSCCPQTMSICSCRSRLKLAVNDLLRLMRGDSSHKTQHELPQLKKRYWGCRFGAVGISQRPMVPSRKTSYFSTPEQHIANPTGVSL